MMRRNLLVSAALLVGVAAPNAGCFLFPQYDTPVIEGEDVRMETPGSEFRSGDKGEVYTVAEETAADANEWVTETVEELAAIVRELNNYPEDSRTGAWRVYGPYDDEDGLDLSWLVRISGDGGKSSVEILVGRKGARGDGEMDAILWGDIAVEQSSRNGGFAIDFDALQRYDDLKDEDEHDVEYGGLIEVSFMRNVDTELKYVDMEFVDFFAECPDESIYFDDEAYAFHREDEGHGTFHLAALGTFEEDGLSGPDLETMSIDVVWNAKEEGLARGRLTGGDLKLGDLELLECFGTGGRLTHSTISDAYAKEWPEYLSGDPATCAFGEEDLPQ